MKQKDDNNNIGASIISITGYLAAMAEDTSQSKNLIARITNAIDSISFGDISKALLVIPDSINKNLQLMFGKLHITVTSLITKFDKFYKRWEETLLPDTNEVTTNFLLTEILEQMYAIIAKIVHNKSITAKMQGTRAIKSSTAAPTKPPENSIDKIGKVDFTQHVKFLELLKDKTISENVKLFTKMVIEMSKVNVGNLQKMNQELATYIKQMNKVSTFKAMFGNKGTTGLMIGIGVGVMMLVIALQLLRTVSWGAVFKLIVFLIAIVAIIKQLRLTGSKLNVNRLGIKKFVAAKIAGMYDNMSANLSMGYMFLMVSFGVLMMAIALMIVQTVQFASAFTLIAFMLMVVLLMRIIPKDISLFSLATGLIFLVFAMFMMSTVDLPTIGYFLIILAALGLVLTKFFGKRLGANIGTTIIRISLALMVLTFSLLLMSTLSWNTLAKAGVVLGGLLLSLFISALIAKKLGVGGRNDPLGKIAGSMLKLTIALILLTIVDFGKLVVIMGMLTLLITSLSVLAAKLKGSKMHIQLMVMAVTFAFIAGVMYLIATKFAIGAQELVNFGFVLTAMILLFTAVALSNKIFKGQNLAGRFNIIMISALKMLGTVLLMTGLLYLISRANFTFNTIVGIVIVFGAIILFFVMMKFIDKIIGSRQLKNVGKLLSSIGRAIFKGVIQLLLVIGVLAIAAATALVVQYTVSKLNIWLIVGFLGGLAILAFICWLIAPFAPMMILGAVGLLAVASVLLVVALTLLLFAIAIKTLQNTDFSAFSNALKAIFGAFADLAPVVGDVLITALILIPVAIASILLALVLKLLALIPMPDFTKFKISVQGLVRAYSEMGWGEVGTALVFSIAVIIIAVLSLVAMIAMLIVAAFPALSFQNFQLSINSLISVYINDTLTWQNVLLSLGMSLLILILAVFSLIIAIAMVIIVGIVQLISLEDFILFKQCITKLYETYAEIDIGRLAVGLVVSVLVLIIAVISIVVALTIGIVSEAVQTLQPDTFKKFKDSIKHLGEAYNTFGVWQATKIGAKALLLLPLAKTSNEIAEVLLKLGQVNVTPEQMKVFSDTMIMFVNEIGNTIYKAKDKLEEIKPALESLATLVGIGSQLAQIIQDFSALHFNVYGVNKEGNIYVKEVKQIKPEDFKMIGENMGRLIGALLDPLFEIASDKDVWIFGGITIKNPFKGSGIFGGGKNKGTDRLKKLGEAYEPLSNVLKNISEMGIITNPDAMERFKQAMGVTIVSIVDTVHAFSKVDDEKIKNSSEKLKTFSESFKGFEGLQGTSDSLIKMIDTLANDDTWNKINKNIEKMSSNIKKFVDNINKLNDKKAKVLYDNLNVLSNVRSQEKLIEVLTELRNLIGDLNEGKSNNVNRTYAAPSPAPYAASSTGTFGGGTASSSVSTANLEKIVEELKQAISNMSEANDTNAKDVLGALDRILTNVYNVKVERSENSIHLQNQL
jgi:hypothetical protein